jgi:hypothetical protein
MVGEEGHIGTGQGLREYAKIRSYTPDVSRPREIVLRDFRSDDAGSEISVTR